MTEPFISAELVVAANPLNFVSNLKLCTLPIDAYSCFELWMPEPNTVLTREEALLLMSDRPRLEEICSQLTWLLGATLIEQEAGVCQSLLYSWQDVLIHLHEAQVRYDAIGVTYLPQAICPNLSIHGTSTAWTLSPASWSILFFVLEPTVGGYRAATQPVSLLITAGRAITRPTHNSAIKAIFS